MAHLYREGECVFSVLPFAAGQLAAEVPVKRDIHRKRTRRSRHTASEQKHNLRLMMVPVRAWLSKT